MLKKICPINVLETLGIDNYSLDYETHSVYLTEQEYRKIAEYFGKSQISSEFEEGGWRWVCCDAKGSEAV